MANKINEIIEVINNGESVEGLTARVDNLEDDLNNFEEQTNQNVADLGNYAGQIDTNLTNRINSLDEKIDDVENPVWVLCDDITSVYEEDHLYIKFTKDVKIIFKLRYDYQIPNVINISSDYIVYALYIKKGDIFYYNQKMLPVMSGVFYPDSAYKNTVSFDITFNTLIYNFPNDFVYHAYTEYVNLENTVSNYRDEFTFHRQNQSIIYDSTSFVNVYVKDGE